MSAELHRMLAIMGRPAYVKTAAEQPHRERGSDYPINSRESTYLSWCTALSKSASTSEMNTIETAGKFWGIHSDLVSAQQKWAEATETRQPVDDDFVVVQEHRGQKVRKFAAYDASSTVKAAESFYDHRIKYPFSWRKEASVRLLQKAAEFKAALPEYIDNYLHKAAGLGFPTNESVERSLSSRMNKVAAKHEEAMNKLATVLGMIADNPALRFNDELVKTALSVMDQFDTETGANRHYGSGVSLPEEMIGVTEPELQKMAANQEQEVTLTNGATVKVSSLDKALLTAVDPELAKLSTAELMDVLPSTPRCDADLIVRLLA